MKKLFSLILVGLILLAGSILGQESLSGPSGVPGDRPGKPSGPRLPSLVKDSDQIKTFAAEFSDFRDTFRTRLAEMKKNLQEASEEEKSQKREAIRQLLKDHRAKQIEYRKNVRRVTSDIREQKLTKKEGSGG